MIKKNKLILFIYFILCSTIQCSTLDLYISFEKEEGRYFLNFTREKNHLSFDEVDDEALDEDHAQSMPPFVFLKKEVERTGQTKEYIIAVIATVAQKLRQNNTPEDVIKYYKKQLRRKAKS